MKQRRRKRLSGFEEWVGIHIICILHWQQYGCFTDWGWILLRWFFMFYMCAEDFSGYIIKLEWILYDEYTHRWYTFATVDVVKINGGIFICLKTWRDILIYKLNFCVDLIWKEWVQSPTIQCQAGVWIAIINRFS